MRDHVIVVLPTYNERDNLPDIVARLRAAVPQLSILVVDDNSPDGTGVLADAIAAVDSQVHVLHRSEKTGLGGAYLAGFAWALENGYQVIVECDADGSHAPEQLPRLLDALDDCDLAVGSRWVAGGSVVDWPLRRRMLSRAGSAYAGLMLGLAPRDITGGFRAFRAPALRALQLDTVSSQGYCFQIELLWRASAAGLDIREVPITFAERIKGASKMSGNIVTEAMWRVTQWGVGRLLGRSAFELTARQPVSA